MFRCIRPGGGLLKNYFPIYYFHFIFADVMVLNDIIEQAAAVDRQRRESDRGGKYANGLTF